MYAVSTVTVHKSRLKPGMTILAPAWMRDSETGWRVPLADLWAPARAPLLFVVVSWDWEGGETLLVARDESCMDPNVCDFPDEIRVLVSDE